MAFAAAGCAYALIVLGAVVRITGSGMGCGDDWPLCNGRLIPALDDVKAVLEWSHRLLALALSFLVAGTAALAYQLRGAPGAAGAGAPIRPAMLALVLLGIQVALGAITVALELPPASVVIHLAIALALIAALLATGFKAGGATQHGALPAGRGAIVGAAVLAAAVLLFGGLTANLGAGPSCQGFPLCNGQIWPTSGGGGLPHIHWTHRILAYAFLLHMLGLGWRLRKTQISDNLKEALYFAVGLTVAQVVVAAIMVLTYLPPVWRVLHVALGTGVWIALVYALCLASCRSERMVA